MGNKEKKILLIEPPFYRLYNTNASLNKFPLSLGYLAGAIVLHKPEWQVGIYNADFSPQDEPLDLKYATGPGFANYRNNLNDPSALIWEEIRRKISKFRPSVVGITAKSQNYASACVVAKIAKSIDRNIIVIVGGPHPSLTGCEILKDPVIDIGVLREGEETIVDILHSIEGRLPLSAIKGIVYRSGEDTIQNPLREFITDLDSLPFPITLVEKTLIDYSKYPLDAFKYIFAVRGCPYNCIFCGSRNIWSRVVRFRSIDNIISELLEIHKFGVKYIHFDDDTFGVKKSFIGKLCGAIKARFHGLNWSCEMHVKLVDEETIALMKSAGCRSIYLGVESGSNQMLNRIRKDITIEEAICAAEIIKKNRIFLQTFFMVGFPDETEKTLTDTISAIESFPTDNLVYSIFTPYMGTEIFDYCKEQGIISDDFDISLYNHRSPENYFCPNIPKDIFESRLRKLEEMIDHVNSRRKVKKWFSREAYLKVREKGIKRTILRLFHISRNAILLKESVRN